MKGLISIRASPKMKTKIRAKVGTQRVRTKMNAKSEGETKMKMK